MNNHRMNRLWNVLRIDFFLRACAIFISCIAPTSILAAPGHVQETEMAGYLLVPNEKVPESFNAGFSMYVAAWPILSHYPGHRFQTGLFGTWMAAQYDGPKPVKFYSDVEGGLGWWRDTRFPSETPKFMMGGVAPNFTDIANGPGHGWGTWKKPQGLYGVAQLSPWLLFPIDGLNLKQGTTGELFGYGYLPLPLTSPKPTTDGQNIPTGANCWTLFLNSANFKGPVAFFTPYFWSHESVVTPKFSGLLLDTRPSEPNRALQMETQYIPSYQAVDAKGETYARIAPTSFPREANGDSMVVHHITSYSRKALYDSVKAWFDGGPSASGAIDPQGSILHAFSGHGGSTWQIYLPSTTKENKTAIDWKSIGSPTAIDPNTFGYHWNNDVVTTDGPLVTLPQYYHLVTTPAKKTLWVPVKAGEVPADTGLAGLKFDRPKEAKQETYTTPIDSPAEATNCWKKPGPAAGPFQAHLGDGTTITYYWYRFADQPALLNADLTDPEREHMQKLVEKLHKTWTKDREYLAPPTRGKLAELDPALIVNPPAGMEIGYVPIATRQGED